MFSSHRITAQIPCFSRRQAINSFKKYSRLACREPEPCTCHIAYVECMRIDLNQLTLLPNNFIYHTVFLFTDLMHYTTEIICFRQKVAEWPFYSFEKAEEK